MNINRIKKNIKKVEEIVENIDVQDVINRMETDKENSIEEDIILLNDFAEGDFQRDKLENYKGSYKMGYFYYKNIQQAIEHILSDYKRVLKEDEQLRTEVNSLKKENEELNEKILDNAGIYQLGFKDGEESYIKKVKDKIRRNEEIIDISNDGDLIHELYQKNKVYEELLESEE